MKKQLNEQFKRMQLLAGLITESQINEGIKTIDANSRDFKVEGNEDLKPTDLKPGVMISTIKSFGDKAEFEDNAGKFDRIEGNYIYWKTKSGKEKSWSHIEDLALVKNLEMTQSEPTSESIDIEKSVNEALRKYRKLITKSQLNEAVKSIDSNTIQRTGDTPITKEDLVIGTTRVAPSMSYGSKEELALNAGTVTKVDGDKATYDVKGKIHSMDLADLLIVITT